MTVRSKVARLLRGLAKRVDPPSRGAQLAYDLAEAIYNGDARKLALMGGRPLNYSAATRAEHRNHVHPAVYLDGGPLQSSLKQVRLDPDECFVSGEDLRAGRWKCSRSGHPTATSDCATGKLPLPPDVP